MEENIDINGRRDIQSLFGPHDRQIREIEEECGVRIHLRGGSLRIKGSSRGVEKAKSVIDAMLAAEETGQPLDVRCLARNMRSSRKMAYDLEGVFLSGKTRQHLQKDIEPKSAGQKEYITAIKGHDIVFSLGPAGTGKTYLAMSCAVEALKSGEVRRLVLTRPAVEAAGESLGFLPGDMYEKISPYLRPLYDALHDMMDSARIEKYIESGVIEVAPLAYMRGRTLNDAFIILDEAQNCTAEQMKMFLTRMGFGSKAVITGDPTQSDLPGGRPAGLLEAQKLLKSVEGIKFAYLSGSDVVRHPLVQKIIEAYDTNGIEK